MENDQHEGKSVAVLESRGSKGCVQVNGKTIKKNTTCDLNSGDEVVFGFLGNHAYSSSNLYHTVMHVASRLTCLASFFFFFVLKIPLTSMYLSLSSIDQPLN